MSLNWSWDSKCGEAVVEQNYGDEKHTFTMTLYEGNAYLIFLHEYQDDNGTNMYNLWNFWADKEHMQKCLGLKKTRDGELRNLHDGDTSRITKFRFNKAKSRYYKEIVKAVTQAFDNITIELYTEE